MSKSYSNEVIGRSKLMVELLQKAERIALSEAPVLICGETGTGKEVLARTIHDLGGATRPFIPIDCSGLPEHLVESELFGHAKGAFTGAAEAKRGLVALADGGTAFFDEIGELPLNQQAKLLRLLQEREFRPVGSTTTLKARFRVLAATNRDLWAETRAGRFREDLFYRLAALRITVPPLRERREDIPELIEHFSSRNQPPLEIPPYVVSRLADLNWPGNVRQLQNCIACMAALGDCPLLGAERHCEFLSHSGSVSMRTAFDESATEEQESLFLPQLKRKAVAKALNRTGGDKTRAAILLGIGRSTLYRQMKEFEIAS